MNKAKKLPVVGLLVAVAGLSLGNTLFTAFSYLVTGGTQTRTDPDRWNDRGINIMEFGAVGDGSHDDTTSIQAAIDYSIASKGSRAIYCPQGTYKISNTIFLDPLASTRGSASAWSGATTYHVGDLVKRLGMQWAAAVSMTSLALAGGGSGYAVGDELILTGGDFSQPAHLIVDTLSGSAIATFHISVNGAYSSDGGSYRATGGSGTSASFNTAAFGTNLNHDPNDEIGYTELTWWVPSMAASSAAAQNGSFSFEGSQALGPGSNSKAGCIFVPTFSNIPAVIVAAGNGNVVSNLQIIGSGQRVNSGTLAGFRCSLPSTGVGLGVMSAGGGASRTKIVNTTVQGFYAGIELGYLGTGALADSNTLEKIWVTNSCVGVVGNETQAYINSCYDCSVSATTGIDASLGTGFNVINGNGSVNDGPQSAIAVTGTSCAATNNLITCTATITTPDDYFNQPACAPSGRCVYNAFVFKTAAFGLLPFTLGSYNSATKKITLELLPAWWTPTGNTAAQATALFTDLNSQTTLYAAERVTTFHGTGISATGMHVENCCGAGPSNQVTTLISSEARFGGARPNILHNIFLDYDGSAGDWATQPSAYVQQAFPFMDMKGVSLEIDGLSGSSTYERMLVDYGGGQLTVKNMTVGNLLFHSRVSLTSLVDQNGASASGGTFSNNYQFTDAAGLGGGNWENAGGFIAKNGNDPSWVGTPATYPDKMRAYGWGQTPMWGHRPAGYAQSCLPAQFVSTLTGALPAITYTTGLNSTVLNAAGTGYSIGNVLTLVGGTNSIPAQITVDTLGASGAVATFHISNTGNYSVVASSFTVTGGGGSGATFNTPVWGQIRAAGPPPETFVTGPTYTVSYPILWGGQQYKICDWNAPAHNTIVSSSNIVTNGTTAAGNPTVHVASVPSWVAANATITNQTNPSSIAAATKVSTTGAGTITMSANATGSGIASGDVIVISGGHKFYSYGQDLTTTNVPRLSWSLKRQSQSLYLNNEAMQLMFPGLGLQLTCSSQIKSVIVNEVHYSTGYVQIMNADQDGTPYLTDFGGDCTGTTIGQAPYSITQF